MAENSVGAYIRKAESDYISGVTHISKYVEFSQYENIEKIDAYLNSKHISGELDSLGREKPFFNIVSGAVNVWYRSTDIDRKDIRIKATNSKEYIAAFLATVHLQEYMKRDSFGQFLNEWGRSLARYGSSVCKFVIKGGKLHSEVVSWNRIISDTVDFESNPVVEKLYFTQAQLKSNPSYDQAKVDELITALTKRKGVGRETKDNRLNYIELYEIHGNFPLSFMTGKKKDERTFTQQMHVISYVKGEKPDENKDFTLFKAREKQSPYLLTHLIKEDGRAQGIGAVEYLFEAQWMENHTVKAIKDQLDIASKVFFQTADPAFVGQNVLTNLENGEIFIHKDNSPLTQVQNNSHDITSLQNFGQQWKVLAQELVSTPDSLLGNDAPSGTAWRTVNALQQEAHSLFELMTENKGLAIEQMLRQFVIPFLKTQMNSSKEIALTLSEYNINKINTIYIPNEVKRRSNKIIKDQVLHPDFANQDTQPAQQPDMGAIQGQVQDELKQGIFLTPKDISTKTWQEVFKDLEWEVEVEVTNETGDKAAILETLTTVLQTVIANPAMLSNPNVRMVFNKILETSGVISPVELQEVAAPSSQPAAPVPKEAINYKDAPDDIRRQMEGQAGMKPSQGGGVPSTVGGGMKTKGKIQA